MHTGRSALAMVLGCAVANAPLSVQAYVVREGQWEQAAIEERTEEELGEGIEDVDGGFEDEIEEELQDEDDEEDGGDDDEEEDGDEDDGDDDEEDDEEEDDGDDEEDADEEYDDEDTEIDRSLFFPPDIYGSVFVDFQNDYLFDPKDQDDDAEADTDINESSVSFGLDIYAYFAEPLFINLDATVSTFFEADVGTDRNSRDIDLFVDALNVNWEEERWALIAGKFIPNFSLAYDEAAGLYGSEIAEDDIELSDRIGIGGRFSVSEEGFGTHIFSASVFFVDTTILSGSFVRSNPAQSEEGVKEEDGGPSNTESLESFAVAIDGGNFDALPGFRYHIAGVRQEVDRVLDFEDDPLPNNEIADEYRLAVAGQWQIEVDEETSVTPLLEYVRFWNAEGIKDENRDYMTASALFEHGGWNLALSHTTRIIYNPGNTSDMDALYQISAGYTFESGFGVDVGYRFLDEFDADAHTVGVYVFYYFEFES
jgi:hypothetical protein